MSTRITFNIRNVIKIMTLGFMFILLLSLAGCGSKKSIEEKAGEALVEELMEDAGADVDVDGETITIKGEDGEEIIYGETEWPTSDLAKNIPEFEAGKVIAVVESNDSAMISLEEVAKEDFMDYLDDIKQDYTVDPMEANSEGDVTYLGSNSSGIGVQLYYVDKTLSIIVSKIPQ